MLNYFFHRTIYNTSVAVLDQLDDLYVAYYDTSATEVDRRKVFIDFGPTDEKYLKRLEDWYQDSPNQKYYVKLPRLALTLNGVSYNADRQTASNETREWYNTQLALSNVTEYITDVQPTAYDFHYNLEIFASTLSDFTQLVEQVLVFYNPDLFLRVKEIYPTLNVERNIPVMLDNFSMNYNVEAPNETQRRLIKGTVTFHTESYLYFPRYTSKMIKIINSSYNIDNSGSSAIDSSSSVKTTQYVTSGVGWDTSGNIATSAIPASFSFSGDDYTLSASWFTSAVSYPV